MRGGRRCEAGAAPSVRTTRGPLQVLVTTASRAGGVPLPRLASLVVPAGKPQEPARQPIPPEAGVLSLPARYVNT